MFLLSSGLGQIRIRGAVRWKARFRNTAGDGLVGRIVNCTRPYSVKATPISQAASKPNWPSAKLKLSWERGDKAQERALWSLLLRVAEFPIRRRRFRSSGESTSATAHVAGSKWVEWAKCPGPGDQEEAKLPI